MWYFYGFWLREQCYLHLELVVIGLCIFIRCFNKFHFLSSMLAHVCCPRHTVLLTVVGVAGCCCQFIKGQRWPELTLRLVQSLSLGQKDAHRTLFSVWQHIFAMPKAKRYVHAVCNLVCLVCMIVQECFNAVLCIFGHCQWHDCSVVFTENGMWIHMIGQTVYSKLRNWSKWMRKTTCHWRRGEWCTSYWRQGQQDTFLCVVMVQSTCSFVVVQL